LGIAVKDPEFIELVIYQRKDDMKEQELDVESGGFSRSDLDRMSVNAIRFLSVDAVQKANSGHPGMPLGAAPMAYVLWTRFLKHNPANPGWYDRDRFVLSAGHGSMLLYSLLYLTGYALPLEQIKQFRQWGSLTPGHPEYGLAPGVETTTGPLGQGFGNAVGMAIAEAHLAARYNRSGHDIMHHYTYVIASDGDLMEGVSSETASLAGHMGLGKLIVLYDSNSMSLSASTSVTFTEDVSRRFRAFGWHTGLVADGNDLNAIARAIRVARRELDSPTLITVRTHLGYGSPHKQDTWEAHGNPLGEEEVRLTKQALGWPLEPPFYVPEQVLKHFHRAIRLGRKQEAEWQTRVDRYAEEFPDLAEEFEHVMQGKLADDWDSAIPHFSGGTKLATRSAVGKAMNATAPRLPGLIGGSGDLDPSTFTALAGLGDFGISPEAGTDTQGSDGGGWSYAGANLHFGVREHGMASILNGLAVHGGTIPYGATFLIFSDYMRPPMRLAALMKAHVIYVFTHDSIGLGEDGPTHQPVEQLLGLRAIPNMTVIRPADANEATVAWEIAVEHSGGPVALALSRQALPVLDLQQYPQIPLGVKSGGYVLVHSQHRPDVILVSTGAEVHLALAAREKLAAEGLQVRVVSLPSWNLFAAQPQEYREDVLPEDIPTLAIEAGAPLGWLPYFGPHLAGVIGVDHFGASAPGDVVLREYGFNLDNVVRKVHEALQTSKTRVKPGVKELKR
jgi:transketolase